ncbi:hypothetical protein vseg_007955 [Gypsophila vaccaria]
MLRSGRVLEEIEKPMKTKDKTSEIEKKCEPSCVKGKDKVIDIDEEPPSVIMAPSHPPRVYTPLVPYSQRFAKVKLEKKYEKLLNILKTVNVEVPFLDIVSEIPSYWKFLKELISKKRKIEYVQSMSLSHESSAMLMKKIPPKLEDQGRFSIPCSIHDFKINKTLSDLGASVILILFSNFKRSKLEDLKPTKVSL